MLISEVRKCAEDVVGSLRAGQGDELGQGEHVSGIKRTGERPRSGELEEASLQKSRIQKG